MKRFAAFPRTYLPALAAIVLGMMIGGCGGRVEDGMATSTPIAVYTPAAIGSTVDAGATATPLPDAEPSATAAAPATATPTATTAATAPPTDTPPSMPTTAPITTSVAEPAAPAESSEPVESTATAEPAAPSEPTVAATTATNAAPQPTDDAPTAAPEGSLLPPEVADRLPDADAADGSQLTVSNGCIACHALQEGRVLVGPSWYNVGAAAATRVEGLSAPEYLYQSIIEPNAHLVEGFQPNLMPQVYKDTLAPEQLVDIIAYLLSLNAE